MKLHMHSYSFLLAWDFLLKVIFFLKKIEAEVVIFIFMNLFLLKETMHGPTTVSPHAFRLQVKSDKCAISYRKLHYLVC